MPYIELTTTFSQKSDTFTHGCGVRMTFAIQHTVPCVIAVTHMIKLMLML